MHIKTECSDVQISQIHILFTIKQKTYQTIKLRKCCGSKNKQQEEIRLLQVDDMIGYKKSEFVTDLSRKSMLGSKAEEQQLLLSLKPV